MINNRKVVVILPAYNASATLESTFNDIPFDIVDEVVLTDDGSSDNTVEIAHRLNIHHVIKHELNMGYGANQKSCYKKALALDADIIVMLHPDYQYTPRLIPSMVSIISNDIYSVVLGSRILGNGALKGGMPLYKYVANRVLTFFQNLMIGAKLSEYHTGYRAFSREVLLKINIDANSNGFVFDNEMLSQILYAGYEVAEVTCPTRYFKEASSIGFMKSIIYGLGVMQVSFKHALQKTGIFKFDLYRK
jgi:glycosyltransferase involved in cell wall biosynthesis